MEILQYLDINFILIIFLIFALAGLIKGVIGVGLPTVSLALLSFILIQKLYWEFYLYY